jgi:hypothetical protein
VRKVAKYHSILTGATLGFIFTRSVAHYYFFLGKGKEGGKEHMAKVIECLKAHYEVQDLEMGKVYRWCPERAVVECTCGEEPTLSAFRSTCPECGADHAPIVEEVLAARPEEGNGDHPWRSLQPHTPTRGA